MYSIKSLDVRSCARLLGALYGALALLVVPFGLIGVFVSAIKGDSAGIGTSFLLIVAPLLYAILGFLFGGLSSWVYNLVATWVGGIEIELSEQTSGGSTSTTRIGLN